MAKVSSNPAGEGDGSDVVECIHCGDPLHIVKGGSWYHLTGETHCERPTPSYHVKEAEEVGWMMRGQGDCVNLDEAAAENERRRVALTGSASGGNLPTSGEVDNYAVRWTCPNSGFDSHDTWDDETEQYDERPWPRCKRCFLTIEAGRGSDLYERFKDQAETP